MKLSHLAVCLAFTSAAFAVPGSYAPVTVSLTLADFIVAPPATLKTGNLQFVASEQVQKITNATILAACQAKELIPAGPLTGWQIYMVSNDDNPDNFFARRGEEPGVLISSVMKIHYINDARSIKGKWVETPGGTLLSGATTYRHGFIFQLMIGGETYLSTVVSSISDKVIIFGDDYAWRPGAWKMAIAGVNDPDDGSEDSSKALQGSVSIKASTAVASIGALFPAMGE